MSRYELDDVKSAAVGYWPAILNRVAGIDDDYLSNRHGPCRKCGGTDRWRFTNLNNHGGAICNQCGKMGDGLAVIMEMTGCGFAEAIKQVAEFLGVKPSTTNRKSLSKDTKLDPFRNIELQPDNEQTLSFWCWQKRLSLEAIKKAKPRIAKYRKRHTVIAMPLTSDSGEPIGWTMYEAFGGKLPLYDPKTKETEWLKVKTLKLKD
ncbi:primase-helicase zinc-binding domain-containing protein [Allorhodopirellula solitaria]|uniref:Zinc-binding domain of primase-helicase n=1 Tax=Allorhodopirellula solitaria TaxID=2527987 RepID=A0A5C5WMW2_9BACT|nr:primase-helicase zinc-binding domain-containing protein [Allorhodopirellula solitaria]TWT52154.1 Zinc-binding domain of primase-helicase [Allorhodopirellula solitaria]